MTSEHDLQAEIEKLKAENQQLKEKKGKQQGITWKVSEKGGLSVYGLGRFPVTLYKEQWLRLLDKTTDILAFLKEHDSELKQKE